MHYAHAGTHTHTHTSTHICMHTHIHLHAHTHTRVHTHTHTFACTRTRTHTLACTRLKLWAVKYTLNLFSNLINDHLLWLPNNNKGAFNEVPNRPQLRNKNRNPPPLQQNIEVDMVGLNQFWWNDRWSNEHCVPQLDFQVWRYCLSLKPSVEIPGFYWLIVLAQNTKLFQVWKWWIYLFRDLKYGKWSWNEKLGERVWLIFFFFFWSTEYCGNEDWLRIDFIHIDRIL